MIKDTQIKNTSISIGQSVTVFYSIKLKDAPTLFSFDIQTLNHLRAICVIMLHINAYSRSVQTTLLKIYLISQPTLKQVLPLLIYNGLVRTIIQKRMTNINKRVPLTTYIITPEGREAVKRINSLLEYKLSKIRQ